MKSCLIFVSCFMLLLLLSCTEETQRSEIPEEVPEVQVGLTRLDVVFRDFMRQGRALKEDEIRRKLDGHLPFLQEWLFNGDTTVADSLYPLFIQYFCQDPRSAQLTDSVLKHFPEGYDFKGILQPPFRRFHFYFPNEPLPKVYFYLTGYQPESGLKDQSYLSERFLGISLDYFLGEKFPFYAGDLPKYIRRRCKPDYLPVAAMRHFAEYLHPEPDISQSPMFIDYIVTQGLWQAFLEDMLPDVPDSVRLSYTSAQMAFVRSYEADIYKELVPLLFSTDYMKFEKYLNDKPYTPNLSAESADRLGMFLGWKIIQAFRAKHPDVSWPDLMKRRDHKKIFEASRYKPL
jgi:hypothetical protein